MLEASTNADMIKRAVEDSLQEGKRQQQKGEFVAAIAAYRQAIKLEPDSVTAYQGLGESLSKTGKFSEAIAVYRSAIYIHSNFAGFHHGLGVALSKNGDWQGAIAAYEQAISINPNFSWSYYHLGVALNQVGEIQKAISTYEKLIALNPEYSWSYYNLGNLWMKQGNLDGATAIYQKAVNLNPEAAEIQDALGDCYLQKNNLEQAISCFKKAIDLNPNRAKTYLKLGRALKKINCIDDAIRAYLNIIKIKPESAEPYLQLRTLIRYYISVDSPVLDDAISCFNHALNKHPHLPFARSSLGYALSKKGQIEDAILAYQQASLDKAKQWRPKISHRSWKHAQKKAPTYIIIGAEKCGTTSLYHYINQHPQCLPPIEKELEFFDLEFDKGIDWYLAHFPPVPQEGVFVTGETSPNYIYSRQAPRRVFQNFPDTKLIVILRNPVDRTFSRYNMIVRNGWEKRSFQNAIQQEIDALQQETSNDKISWEALDRNRHIGNSLYFYHLKRWLSLFSREQLSIVKSEDLYQNPDRTIQKIFSFLNISPHQLSNYKQHNAGIYSPIEEETRRDLANFFEPHNRKLENYLGCSFNWY